MLRMQRQIIVIVYLSIVGFILFYPATIITEYIKTGHVGSVAQLLEVLRPLAGDDIFLNSVAYDTPQYRISIDKKPIDCDFMTSPIGNKGCAYVVYRVYFKIKSVNGRNYVSINDESHNEMVGQLTDKMTDNLLFVQWKKIKSN